MTHRFPSRQRRLQHREHARARERSPAAPGLRFRRWRGRGRADAAPQRGAPSATSSCCRGRSTARRARPLGRAVRPPPEPAGHDRPDRARRPVLARRRVLQRARRARPPAPPTASAMARSARSRSSPRRGVAPRWMQVFIYQRSRLHRASSPSAPQAAGYDALVLTIDNQLIGNRERDIRNGFTIPPRFGAAEHCRHGARSCPGSGACASELQAHHLRQLCPARRADRHRDARRTHGVDARPVDVLARCR